VGFQVPVGGGDPRGGAVSSPLRRRANREVGRFQAPCGGGRTTRWGGSRLSVVEDNREVGRPQDLRGGGEPRVQSVLGFSRWISGALDLCLLCNTVPMLGIRLGCGVDFRRGFWLVCRGEELQIRGKWRRTIFVRVCRCGYNCLQISRNLV
jgi:hypothetical protein